MVPAEKLLMERQKIWDELKGMERLTPETFDRRIIKFQKRAASLSVKESKEIKNEVKRMKISRERMEVERLYRKLRQEAEEKMRRKKRELYNKYKTITRKLQRLGVA